MINFSNKFEYSDSVEQGLDRLEGICEILESNPNKFINEGFVSVLCEIEGQDALVSVSTLPNATDPETPYLLVSIMFNEGMYVSFAIDSVIGVIEETKCNKDGKTMKSSDGEEICFNGQIFDDTFLDDAVEICKQTLEDQ